MARVSLSVKQVGVGKKVKDLNLRAEASPSPSKRRHWVVFCIMLWQGLAIVGRVSPLPGSARVLYSFAPRPLTCKCASCANLFSIVLRSLTRHSLQAGLVANVVVLGLGWRFFIKSCWSSFACLRARCAPWVEPVENNKQVMGRGHHKQGNLHKLRRRWPSHAWDIGRSS